MPNFEDLTPTEMVHLMVSYEETYGIPPTIESLYEYQDYRDYDKHLCLQQNAPDNSLGLIIIR